MTKEQISKLLNTPEYLVLEKYVETEILKSERKAIESIHSGEIDKESANRAIPRNKLRSMKMNEKKTAL